MLWCEDRFLGIVVRERIGIMWQCSLKLSCGKFRFSRLRKPPDGTLRKEYSASAESTSAIFSSFSHSIEGQPGLATLASSWVGSQVAQPGGTTRLNFPSSADHRQCTASGPAAHYEILDSVNVYQPVHGFTTVNDVFIDSTIAFERMRSCFVKTRRFPASTHHPCS